MQDLVQPWPKDVNCIIILLGPACGEIGWWHHCDAFHLLLSAVQVHLWNPVASLNAVVTTELQSGFVIKQCSAQCRMASSCSKWLFKGFSLAFFKVWHNKVHKQLSSCKGQRKSLRDQCFGRLPSLLVLAEPVPCWDFQHFALGRVGQHLGQELIQLRDRGYKVGK